MQPLNAAERKKAFLSFLLFFVLTTALIVATVVAGFQVPTRQIGRLQQQVAAYDRQKLFTESFAEKMEDTKTLLDSVNRPGVQAALVDGRISDNLKTMNSMVDADTAAVKKLYQDIVHNLADLQDAKKQLRAAAAQDANLSQNLQQIEMLKSDLNQARNEATALRLQLMSLQPRQ